MESIAAGASVAGALAIYLASPHQTWRARALPPRVRWFGLGLLAVAQALWAIALQPLAGTFAGLALLMLLLAALPALGALARVLRGAGGAHD